MALFDSVWERRGYSTMSKALYSVLICAFTLLGILVTGIAAYLTQNMKLAWYMYLILVAVTFGGTFLTIKSDNPMLSFLGYMLVTIPFGLIMGPLVAQYTSASLMSVLFITAVVVAVLGVIGAIIKKDLAKWLPYLLVALIVLLVGYFILPIAGLFGLPIEKPLGWLDWIAIVVFCFMVVFDWNRAMRIPFTLDNSIDSALSIYLDFINIALRLLGRTGSKKN